MSEVSGRPCPSCGTQVPAGQRFCSNCGNDMSAIAPASQYGGPPPQNYPLAPQVPPYAQQAPSYPQPPQQVPPYAQSPQQVPPYASPQQQSSPIAEALGALGLLFFLRRYRPGYVARRQSSGCCGCLVALVIMGIVFGIPGYIAYKNYSPQIQRQIQNAQANNGQLPTTQPPITTANINQTVTYAGVDLTLVSVQQSTAFLDDNSSATNGMIRVNIKEANNTSGSPNYFYGDIAKMLLPDQSSVSLARDQQDISPANGVTRNNWLDFAVPTSDKIEQLTLVLGTSKDAQIRIPLTGKANLSAFQPKTINPNTPISYAGLNWTLKSATVSLNADDKQASTGMRYVVLTFNIDNPGSSDVVIGFTNEYMRLKSGDTTSPALSTTLPLSVNAQTNGVTGMVTFLMPQNASSFTLIMLAGLQGSDPHSSVQVNTNFTVG